MICTNCYRYDLEAHELFLMRVDRQWVMRCRRCVPANIDLPEAGAVEWLAASENVKVPAEIWHFITAFWQANRQTARAAQTQNLRRYERYALRFIADYELPENPADHGRARVLNVSRCGIALLAAREMAAGKRYKMKITNAEGEQLKVNFTGEIEIARCRYLDDSQKYEVGGKFCEPELTAKNSAADSALANVWYQRRTVSSLRRARMLDFNCSGISLVVQENLEPQEVVFICIRGNSGLFRNQEVRAVMRVVDIEQIYADHYAIVAEFVKTTTAAAR